MRLSERRTGTRLGAKEWTLQDLQLVADRGAVRDYRLRCSHPHPGECGTLGTLCARDAGRQAQDPRRHNGKPAGSGGGGLAGSPVPRH